MITSAEYTGLGVRVGASPTGLGVFAVRRFRSRETIGRMKGRTFRDPDYESDYCVDLGGGLSLEPAAPFRYLNHSCEPNCVLVNVGAWDAKRRTVKRQIWVQALRTIRPNEELTIDYGWTAEAAIPCCCGSPKCRGWIVAEDELDRLPPRRKKRSRRG